MGDHINKWKEESKRIEEETLRNKRELETKKFYENVESIKKNVQFFFWLSIISIIVSIIYIVTRVYL